MIQSRKGSLKKKYRRWIRQDQKNLVSLEDARCESDETMANKISTFLQAVRTEMTKVSWPTRDRIIRSTLVVVFAIIVFGLFIGGIDFMFFQVLRFFLG